MARNDSKPELRWAKVDLHIHTPVSSQCYVDKGVGILDILRKAEERELDIIAITDHNSVAGISAMRRRMDTVAFLRQQGRITSEERTELEEYERILSKLLVLPGFEFTATLGFHILGVFPPETTVRKLEHVLLELNVPEDKLDSGTSEIGATTDVLTAYQVLDQAGALVIAAHANSTHGVAMQNFNFGGQTKISYTQDPRLDALEVTDLDAKGRRSTANFYNGTKAEYPRRMHCIQGSDAHRLERDPEDRGGRLGIGERCTEMLLPEISFQAVKQLLESSDFDRTRPFRQPEPVEPVRRAQESGPGLTASFHERAQARNRGYDAVLRDLVAFANTEGGTVYIGAGAGRSPLRGVEDAQRVLDELRQEVEARITPRISVSSSMLPVGARAVLVLEVPKGADTPYVLAPGEIYIREEAETLPASRDDIVRLVLQSVADRRLPIPSEERAAPAELEERPEADSPKTGVEILRSENRDGTVFHTIRDLRNGGVVENVTRFSARRLWRYAIIEQESNPPGRDDIQWLGRYGVWKTYRRGQEMRYNLARLEPGGSVRVFYGVTDAGLVGPWKQFQIVEAPVSQQQEQPTPAVAAAE